MGRLPRFSFFAVQKRKIGRHPHFSTLLFVAESISRDGRIYLHGPGIDPTHHAFRVREPVPAEIRGGFQAALQRPTDARSRGRAVVAIVPSQMPRDHLTVRLDLLRRLALDQEYHQLG